MVPPEAPALAGPGRPDDEWGGLRGKLSAVADHPATSRDYAGMAPSWVRMPS
jgi:hypothetical protein